ncbi:MAG TPA: amidohydrolase [Bacteroidales bacterium]|nr:amidohydrolase [Bacteroidales bacterium]
MSQCTSTPESEKTKVDLILKNATVYTVDSVFSVADFIAVSDGKIVAVGKENDLSGLFESDKVIDLDGAFVYPGFNDAHCHFYSYGYGLENRVDLEGTKSFDEILERLSEYHKTHNYPYIEGRGWDQNDWENKNFPDNKKLDEMFPDIPVVLVRIDGHAALVNSEALKKAGINEKTIIKGGKVEVKNGHTTGILIDMAVDEIMKILPKPTDEQMQNAYVIAQKNCVAAGLTSVTDAGMGLDTIRMAQKLIEENKLKIRINAMLNPTEENFQAFMYKGVYETDLLTVRSVKLYADGALGSRGALLLETYSDDPGNKGILVSSEEYLYKISEMAFEHNYQVCTHAIGDGAVRLMLTVYSEFLHGKNDLRWRIEHAQVVHPDDFKLFAANSIIPSVQATHATSDMYWAKDRIGLDRLKGAYAYKQLLNQNGWLPNGTDFPIEKISPLLTFYAAVFRTDVSGFPEGGFQKENALNRREALKSITFWPAMASFEENKKGTIEPGKFADFTILDTDLLKADKGEIIRANVLKTIINGEIIYNYEK